MIDKFECLKALEHDLTTEDSDQDLTLHDALQLAFNYGYSNGLERGLRDSLYNAQGQQIREVTQAELDWSH